MMEKHSCIQLSVVMMIVLFSDRFLDVELYREYELPIIFMTSSLPNIYLLSTSIFFILHTYCKYLLVMVCDSIIIALITLYVYTKYTFLCFPT